MPSSVPVVPKDGSVSAFELLSDTRIAEAVSDGHKEKPEKLGFGRQQRLLTAGQFTAVFSARRTIRGARFVLHYQACRNEVPAAAAPVARLGLVIPKKQARSAVLRNAIKRQAREVFRHRCRDLPALDIVLRLAQPVASHGKPERAAWCAEIIGLLDQAGRKVRTGMRPAESNP